MATTWPPTWLKQPALLHENKLGKSGAYIPSKWKGSIDREIGKSNGSSTLQITLDVTVLKQTLKNRNSTSTDKMCSAVSQEIEMKSKNSHQVK